MSKTKLIALILLLTVVLMGAGYAYWNETLTVIGTVTTGELNVEFLQYDNMDDIESPYIMHNEGRIDYVESRIAPFKISEDKHTLTAGFKDVFPGMYYFIPFRMENKGTIPAVFKSCTVTSDIDDSTLGGLSESSLLAQLRSNLKISNMELRVYNKDNIRTKTLVVVNGSTIPLSALESTLNNILMLNPIRLEPGDSLQLADTDGKISGGFVRFLFSKDFTNDFQNKRFDVNINTEWKQFNETN